jgi:Transglycosylase SLT domain
MAIVGRILAVPGLQNTTPSFRRLLLELANRNGWDVDAIATVISAESGFKADAHSPLENQTASGLIQMTDATAKSLGIQRGAPAGVIALSAEEQLPYVEAYFKRAFAHLERPRRVDYYLALWGNGIGKPLEHVLARKDDERTFNHGKDNLFSLNAGLDRDQDGQIEVSDLDAAMAARQAQAHGQFVEVDDADPLEIGNLGALGWEPGSPLSPSAQQYLLRLSGSLPVLRRGNRGDLVAVLQFELGLSPDEIFGPKTEQAVIAFQDAQGIDSEVSPEGRPLPAGCVGVHTWGRLFERRAEGVA